MRVRETLCYRTQETGHNSQPAGMFSAASLAGHEETAQMSTAIRCHFRKYTEIQQRINRKSPPALVGFIKKMFMPRADWWTVHCSEQAGKMNSKQMFSRYVSRPWPNPPPSEESPRVTSKQRKPYQLDKFLWRGQKLAGWCPTPCSLVLQTQQKFFLSQSPKPPKTAAEAPLWWM